MEQENQPVATHESPEDNQEVETEQVAYSTYRKLLGEKKSRDAKLREMQAQLEQYEAQAMEQEQDLTKKVDLFKTQAESAKAELTELKSRIAENTISNQVKQKAVEAGCINADDLYSLVRNEPSFKAINIDDNYNIDAESLDELIKNAKKEKSYLFKKTDVQVHDIKQSHVPSGKKPVEKMSIEELKQAILK